MNEEIKAVLDQLDQARQKATPGPWVTYEEHGRDWADEAWSFLGIRAMTGTLPQVAQTAPLTMDGENELAREDAALIVAAVNALPALTAALRAVLDVADELQGWPYARLMSPHDAAARIYRALDGTP